jgi:hypothetical protein
MIVKVTMDGKPLLLFPQLDCAYFSLEIAGDLFPGVQAIGSGTQPRSRFLIGVF